MKKLMIMGGLTGFAIGLVFGLIQGSAWPSIIWRASVATLGAGMLVRWWGSVWVQALRETYSDSAGSEAAHKPALALPKK